MSWQSPPTFVIAGRDRLLESPTIVAMGVVSANFHYPRALPTDALPLVVLDRTDTTTRRAGNGSTYISGTITGVIVVNASTVNDGVFEENADLIGRDIVGLLTDGIFVHSFKVGRAGEPGPGFWAANDAGQADDSCPAVRALPFVMEWGDP